MDNDSSRWSGQRMKKQGLRVIEWVKSEDEALQTGEQ
jgi:hypothetical protein